MAPPTFAELPAAVAGQLRPWRFVPLSYPSMTGYLRELAEWLTTSRSLTA